MPIVITFDANCNNELFQVTLCEKFIGNLEKIVLVTSIQKD